MTMRARRNAVTRIWLLCTAVSLLPLLPAARGQAPAGRPIEGLTLTVGLSAEAQRDFQKQLKDEDGDSFPVIDYVADRDKEGLRIQPRLLIPEAGERKSAGASKNRDYLALVEKGGPIEPITFSPEFSVGFPSLDVKLVNNSAKAVFFSEMLVQVESSQPDTTPLPLIFSGYDQVLFFRLVNEGWGPIESCTVKFHLVPKGKGKSAAPAQAPKTPAFEKTFGRFTEDLDVDVGDAAISAGIPAKHVEKARQYVVQEKKKLQLSLSGNEDSVEHRQLEAANTKLYTELTAAGSKKLGPFTDGVGRVIGSLTYTWNDAAGKAQTKTLGFQADVLLVPPDGLGAPGPVTGRYETMLRTEGENYTLAVPISQPVRKGDVDHFLLRLGLPASSRHRLRVRLRATDGSYVESGPIALAGLLPRHAAADLQKGPGDEEEAPDAASPPPAERKQ